MKKISLILIFALLVTSLGAAVYGEEIMTEPELVGESSEVVTDVEKNMEIYNANREVFDLIEGLGISNKTNYTANIKRHEFISAVVNLFKLNIDDSAAVNFFDIDKESDYAAAMKAAYQANLIKEDANGKLNPEKIITYNEAVKIVVCAMGGMSVAEHMGGYPTGYTRIAENWKITKNVSSKNFNYAEAAQLLYNVLRCGTVETYASSEGIQFAYGDEENVEDLYGLRRYEGVVTGNSRTLSISGQDSDGRIEINDTVYTMKLLKAADDDELLGCRVYCYAEIVDGDLGDIVLIGKISDRTTVLEVADEDIMDKSSITTLYYYDSKDNERKMSINRDARYFYNGARCFEVENADMKPKSGMVRLIDNNGDKAADFVFIENYEYHIVDSSVFGRIYCKYDDFYINLNDFDGKIYRDGVEITADYIGEWDTLYMKMAKDGKSGVIDVYSDEISGDVGGFTSKDKKYYIKIGDEQFEVADIYKNAYESHRLDAEEPISGNRYTFALDEQDRVIGIKNTIEEKLEYGYIIGALDAKGLSTTNAQVKIYCKYGVMQVFDCTDNVKVNGVKAEGKLKHFFANSAGEFEPQLIKFERHDGKVSKIVTAIDNTALKNENSEFSLDYKKIGSMWEYSNTPPSVEGYLVLNSQLPAFWIPADITAEERFVYFDASGSLSNINRGGTDLFIYDSIDISDGNGVYAASAMVAREQNKEDYSPSSPYTISSIKFNDIAYVVREIIETVSKDGTITYAIDCYNANTGDEITLNCDEYVFNVDTTNRVGYGTLKIYELEPGDVIQVGYVNEYATKRKVNRFLVLSRSSDYKNPDFYVYVKTDPHGAGDSDIYVNPNARAAGAWTVGEVAFQRGTNYVIHSKNNKGEEVYIPTYYNSSCKIFVYEKENERVTPASIQQVVKGQRLFVRFLSNRMQITIIVKD